MAAMVLGNQKVLLVDGFLDSYHDTSGDDSAPITEEREVVMTLTVDVTSDVNFCPWCFIGKRRLEKAFAASGTAGSAGPRHPFQLNPTMPKEGMNPKRSIARPSSVAGTVVGPRRPSDRSGPGRGITFAFDKIVRTPNTSTPTA